MKKINYLAITLLVGLCLPTLPTQGFAVTGSRGEGTSGGRSLDRGSFGGRSYRGSYSGSHSYGRDSYGYYGQGTGPSSCEQTGFLALAVLSVGGISAFSIVKNKRQEKRLKAEILSRMSGTAKEKKAQLLEIQKIFMRIQSAWEEETPKRTRGYYTDKLFAEHRKVLQKSKVDGVRNRTKKITIQEVGNYRQIHENSFAIRIDFRCCDYSVGWKDGRSISGSKTQRQYFSQMWYFDFSEKEKRWQADFIQPIMLDWQEIFMSGVVTKALSQLPFLNKQCTRNNLSAMRHNFVEYGKRLFKIASYRSRLDISVMTSPLNGV